MGLWDSVSNFMSGGGRQDASKGYDQANQYIAPYRTGGAQDYSNYRNYVGQQGQNLDQFSHSGDWQHQQINQSPTDYYNQIMGGYNESPQAKYEQEQSLRASNAGGAASGMLGSGAAQKALQQNAADISGRDQQRYFQNVGNANQMQMGYLGDLRNQQNQYNSMQQYLTGMGYGAATGSGQNAINKGLSNAQYDQSAFDNIAGLVGAGGQNYKNNSMMNAQGGDQIPWYMMAMM